LIKKEKVVAIVAGSESTRIEAFNQLNPLLKNYAKIESYDTLMGVDFKIKADLAVVTSKIIMQEAASIIDPSCPVIIARRTLNINNLDKLFDVAEGTTALLVNDGQETAMDTIHLLKQMGIDHITFIPYYPDCNISVRSKVAVTPGETALVPDFVETVINIDSRVIDISTIVEVLEHLGLLNETAHFVSAKYIEKIIRLGKQLHDSINETNKMNQYLIKVLNQVNDGIVAFNKEGKITVFNEKCTEIFKCRISQAIKRHISHIIKDKNILDFLNTSPAINDQMFKINDIDVVINKFSLDKLDSTVCTIKNAKETIEMEDKLRRNLIKKGFIGKYTFNDIIGNSNEIKGTKEIAKKLAKVDMSILIQGESGVGKELFASSIHNDSLRNKGPFLGVNFSALPENLVESELFGYEEGAFTGAKKGGKTGLFEQANGGTIFLDEIGDTSLKIQARLLRVLQEREIMRVGGTEIIPIDVRVIAATNRNLAQMCQEGKFREDLYYRLKKLYIKIPPLRARLDDIDELVKYFLTKNGQPDLGLSAEVYKTLFAHKWPGNVRELENTIEYMVAVCDSSMINITHMPNDFFDLEFSTCGTDDHYSLLADYGNVDEFIFILRTIRQYNMQGKTISRKIVSDLSHNGFYFITEEQVRKRTDILMNLKLLTKSKGRKGMYLTLKGINLISNHSDEFILNIKRS